MKNGRKKSPRKRFLLIFIVSFIALSLICEAVLSVVNGIVTRGQKLGYTLPLYIMPFVALAFTGLLLYFINKNQKKSQAVIDAMNRIADGDYSVRIDGRGDKHFGEIYENFNKMAMELSAAYTLRDDFIREFSHEFKTPIASIRGFAEILLEGGLSEEEQKQFIRIINDESARLCILADNTLTLSRLENQQLVGEKTEYRLDEQIKDCIIMLEREWEKKVIEISTELQPVYIRSNGAMLMQVWLNILKNAVKFTPENGRISVSLAEEGGFAIATFTDSGAGISADECKKIFNKYYRAPNAEGYEGNGLGLAICKRICELSGGNISVSSEPGRGSTFTVRLPL